MASKHYKVGMKANGSTIVAIRYPENTQPKYAHWECPARNGVEHMEVELADGRVISSADLLLGSKFTLKDVKKIDKFISKISGGVA